MEKTQNFTNETTEKLLDNYRRLYKKSGPCTLDTRLFQSQSTLISMYCWQKVASIHKTSVSIRHST